MKKLLKKVISLTAALAMSAAYSASATVTTGGGSSATDPYYWQEDFNDYTTGSYSYDTGTKPDCVTIPNTHKLVSVNSYKVSGTDYALEINGSKLSGYQQVKIITNVCNFKSAPVVVQFDATFLSAPQGFRMDLCDTSGNPVTIGNIFQTKNKKWYAYKDAKNNISSQKTITTGTMYRFAAYLVYDADNKKINVKTYVDGDRLVGTVNSVANTPIEYDIDVSTETIQAALEKTLVLRFYPTKDDDVVIDNVTVRNASTVNLSNVGWINADSNSASVGYTNTPAYMDSNSKTVTLTQGLINKIVAANESSQFTLKKYNLGDDPLLLSPTAQTAKVSYSGTNNFTIANLTLSDATKEFYIAKINDTSNFSSITGQATENEYVLLLNSNLASTPIIRETKLYGADGTVLALEGGKLPQNTNKIETVISYYSDVPTTVKIAGVGVNKSATVNGKTCTIDLSDSPLQPGQDYTITVGDVSKTYTATGEKAKMSEAIETFEDSASVTEQVCTSSYITLDKNGNKLLYKNTATSGLPELTYNFNNPFDFDGGNKKMLVSFKVELNQDITYIQTSGKSHLLAPNVSIGSKTVYMPAIEHSGFRARTLPNGGRNGDKPEEYYIQTMTKNKVYYNSVLIEYDATSKTLKYTQYVDGKPMRLKPTNGDAYDVGTFEIENVTEDDLNANISIQFQGRNFAAGGLYIDDLAVTTLGTDFNVLQPVIAADNTVTVDAVNKTESIYIMNIILASYKNNELLDVEYEKVKINFTDRQYKFTPSSEFNTTGATAVKAFVWNEFKNAVPYAANGEK